MTRIVVPGEVVTDQRRQLGEHVYICRGKICATTVGLPRVDDKHASVVPLRGGYLPKRGDMVVGLVAREEYSGYLVNINTVFDSFVSKDEFLRPLKTGALVTARVADVDEVHEAKLDTLRPLQGGTLLAVSPVKIPRVIGRRASMLETLKRGTGCTLFVGRNGWIWARGGNLQLLQKALAKIEAESHTANLTRNIENLLRQARPKHAPRTSLG